MTGTPPTLNPVPDTTADVTADVTADALAYAERAAALSGVRVRELVDLGDLQEVYRFFDSIWHFVPHDPPITVELMRAFAHTGNYVAGAYEGERLVGASAGFLAAPPGQVLHSHVTGASIGRGIGYALKLHQRAWALARGLDRVTWTFDPLVRRNAYFNLVKLGALPEEYLQRFYGTMGDAINGGDESDRVLAVWRLRGARARAACQGRGAVAEVPGGAAIGLADHDGRPVPGPVDAPVVLVAVPRDVERLRAADPGAALAWRQAVREVLGGLMHEGARVTGFHERTYYVVERA
ncbi:putative GNAT superfamily acetyltransferase [Thermocatellispora tengchongensis]|uniref:Putative GNAT superfamily acetyltransferase n=1 Tax=Thermocatellispora tengchongensis TaxID=1073253 RepID=A0A840PD32_9ACTN|nr:GNAT family N-acetyltransferase [Thermocatellispora tengchongensis]MBB5135330.1 putative GNAT superfamily acetyltransferase [Thermocatellispora tengchongensis]